MTNNQTKLDIKQIQFEAKKLKHVSVIPMLDIYIKMYNELSDYLIIDNRDFEQGSIEHNIYNIGLHMENVSESLINLSNTLNRINEYKE
jgi:hypothetical protein